MKIDSTRHRSTKYKILIVDDHPVLRAGLARTIQLEKDLEVCGEATDAREALKKIKDLKPHLALVDLSMEGMSGLDLIKSIRKESSGIRLLVLSMYPETLFAEAALRAGANGYIMKRESGQKLLAAIRTVLLDGKTYLSEEANQVIVEKLLHPKSKEERTPDVVLSERELETFRLIGQGFGTRQIAETLNISMKTVEAHREHIRAKYDLASNYQLVQKAIKWVHQENSLSLRTCNLLSDSLKNK